MVVAASPAMIRASAAYLLLVASACASPDGACHQSIDQFCADHGGQCARNWSELDLAQPDAYACAHDQVSTDCHGYLVYVAHGDDTSTTSYFNSRTGELVAITSFSVAGSHCDVGPADGFTAPACQDLHPPSCP
jgi:hypothetical protein